MKDHSDELHWLSQAFCVTANACQPQNAAQVKYFFKFKEQLPDWEVVALDLEDPSFIDGW